MLLILIAFYSYFRCGSWRKYGKNFVIVCFLAERCNFIAMSDCCRDMLSVSLSVVSRDASVL